MSRNKTNLLLACALLIALLIAFSDIFKSSQKSADQKAAVISRGGDITVSAAASLRNPLEDIKKKYRQINTGTSIAYNFGGSGTLQKQIEEGAPADIFISASKKSMDALESRDLILAESRKDLLGNSLVLIIPKDSSMVKNIQDLAKPEVKVVALGDPDSVPAGTYAKQTLTKLGLYDAIGGKAALSKDVSQVLSYVESGNADAGFVYVTDAASSTKAKIVANVPDDSHDPIIYPMAILKDARYREAAGDFAAYLEGAESKEIFEKYGFKVLEE